MLSTQDKKEFLINCAFLTVVCAIYYIVFKYVVPSTVPFVIAFLVTLIIKGPIEKIAEKTRIPRKGASLIMLAIFYIVVAAVLVLVVFYVIYALINWLGTLPSYFATEISPALERLLDMVEALFKRLDPSYQSFLNNLGTSLLSKLSEVVTAGSKGLLSIAQSIVLSFPKILIGVMFTIIATVFITLDYPKIKEFFAAQFNAGQLNVISTVKDCLKNSLGKILKSYATIMFITFIELSIALSIIKIQNAVLVALLIALIDIVPILGTGTIMIPWSIIALVNGNLSMAWKTALIYIIITIVRNYIEPKIVGAGFGINPLILLLCMYVGARIFGGIGIVVLPFTIFVLKDLNDKGIIHLFKNPNSGEEIALTERKD